MTIKNWKKVLKLAKKGNGKAQFEVGSYFEDGLQIGKKRLLKIDKAKALKWFKKAHKKGNVDATVRYADYLSEGINCNKNMGLAIRLYKRAIKKGSYIAVFNLAKTYSQKKSFSAAFKLYSQIQKEHNKNVIELAFCYYFGLGTTKNKKKAFKIFEVISKDTSMYRNCESEINEANFYLGLMYLEGEVVKKSIKKARKYLKLANEDKDHQTANELLLLIGK
ncbi:MAG: tetratricopeptide repeat protein [Chitinophagales bacterium]